MTKQALKQKISSSLWLLFSAIFISLFSTELLASSENQSIDPNTYLIAAVLGHCDTENFTSNNSIESAIGLEHSASTGREACTNSVKFALEKGASANLLLEFVTYYSVEQKDLLTKIALEKGAKEKLLEHNIFPSKELIEGLLKLKKMNPTTYLYMLANTEENNNSTIPNSDFVAKRSGLIDLSVKYGAKLEELPYPSVAEVIRNKAPFVSFGQGLIMEKLDSLLEKSIPPKEAKKNSVNNLKEEIKKQKGFCMGLTTMWLYSKWLQFTHPEKTGEYSNDWFINTIQDLSLSDDKRICDSDNNLYKFASLMGFFQGVEVEDKQNDDNDLMQLEVEKRLLLSKLDTYGKTLKKKYSTQIIIFNVDQLEKLLDQAVHDHEWVFIFPNNTHALGIFKHDKDYYYYDSNNNVGEYKTTSIKEIAEQISQTALQMQVIDNNLRSNNEIKIGISIFSLDNQENSYPDQKEILIESNKTLTVETAFELAQDSVQTDSFESFKFYLGKAVELNGGNLLDNATPEKKESVFKTIVFAIMNNNPDFIQEILNKGIEPNQLLVINRLPALENSNDPEDIEGLKNLKAGVTMLGGLANAGNIEAMKVLLNDKRTDINLASGFDKKTPLMFAVEENEPEAVKLLLARGANPNLKDKHGNDARTLAELYGCQECIAILNQQ